MFVVFDTRRIYDASNINNETKERDEKIMSVKTKVPTYCYNRCLVFENL